MHFFNAVLRVISHSSPCSFPPVKTTKSQSVIKFSRLFVPAFALLTLLASTAHATEAGYSGLPVPRFVNLKFDEANGRVGPSKDYPVRYVFTRQYLPVRVVEESPDNLWRRIVDHEGKSSWISKSQLVSSGHVMVRETADMRKGPAQSEAVRVRIEAGVLVKLERCEGRWCMIRTQSWRGWLPAESLWGLD